MIHLAAPTTAPATASATTIGPASTAEMFVCPFVLIEDDREQAPWTFSNIIHEKKLLVMRKTRMRLATGDYTISGLEHLFCLERKSADDLMASVTVNHKREAKKQARMRAIIDGGGFARMIIEGSLSEVCEFLNDPTNGRKITSDEILGAQASWEYKYIPWLWAGDRRHAELLAWRVLWRWWCEWTKQAKQETKA